MLKLSYEAHEETWRVITDTWKETMSFYICTWDVFFFRLNLLLAYLVCAYTVILLILKGKPLGFFSAYLSGLDYIKYFYLFENKFYSE